MAYQLWKFGLLGKDFYYRVFAERTGSRRSGPRPRAPRRRGGRRRRSAARHGCATSSTPASPTCRSWSSRHSRRSATAQAAHSVHYAYEMVVLSHATARELGYTIDARRTDRSSRSRAARGWASRPTTCSIGSSKRRRAKSRNATPSWRGAGEAHRRGDRHRGRPLLHGEVLARQGDRLRHRRGAQLRGRERPVSAVRRRPRQQHLQQAEGARRRRPGGVRRRVGDRAVELLASDSEEALDLWGLVLEAARLDDVVEQAVRTLELSVLAKYAFGLAQAFNAFYHRYPILNEERAGRTPVARGGGRLLSRAAHQGAGADGRDGAGEDVDHGQHGPSDDVKKACLHMKPTIGVTRCSRLDDYLASVEQAGGRARVLEVSESPRKVLDEIDGLLLTGGGDVDPVLYGEERHPTVDDAEPGRDEFEIDLARRAVEADLPLLAICRGAQVLNVAAGGTLVQDIPSAVASDCRPQHRGTEERRRARRARDARLAARAGARLDGRRRAHLPRQQPASSIGRPPRDGLDGIGHGARRRRRSDREAGPGFCVGVQWHPENFWRTGEFSPLFDAFVAARTRALWSATSARRMTGREADERGLTRSTRLDGMRQPQPDRNMSKTPGSRRAPCWERDRIRAATQRVAGVQQLPRVRAIVAGSHDT